MDKQTNGNLARIYLRASTGEQDAERAKEELVNFAKSHSLNVVKIYVENASGRTLKRPVLKELIADCTHGEVLLIESIDRLTRLNYKDWQTLKAQLLAKDIKIVVFTVPLSHMILLSETASRTMHIINNVIIEILADAAEQDYLTRRKRAAQGMAKAKAAGKMQGRKPNIKRYKSILKMLDAGCGVVETRDVIGCSINTVYAAKNWREAEQKKAQAKTTLFNQFNQEAEQT